MFPEEDNETCPYTECVIECQKRQVQAEQKVQIFFARKRIGAVKIIRYSIIKTLFANM